MSETGERGEAGPEAGETVWVRGQSVISEETARRAISGLEVSDGLFDAIEDSLDAAASELRQARDGDWTNPLRVGDRVTMALEDVLSATQVYAALRNHYLKPKLDHSVEAQSAREDIANCLQIVRGLELHEVDPIPVWEVARHDRESMERLLRSALKKLEGK